MTPRRPPAATAGLGSGDAADLGLGLLAAAGAAAVLLWAGAALACLATGHPVPAGGLLPAVRALAHPAAPAEAWPVPARVPGPVPYWGCTLTLLAATTSVAALALRTGHRRSGDRADRVRSLPGLATPGQAATVAGRRPLQRRASIVRPSTRAGVPDPLTTVRLLGPAGPAVRLLPTRTRRVAPELVGYRIGTVRGRALWCSVEDSVLLLGPPRMGKGLHVVIPWILDAPGPIVVTSTRPDSLAVTLTARQRRGPVAVFDPQQLAGLPHGLRWSPVRGCQTPRTALVRARGLAAGTGLGTGAGVTDAGFWQGQTETALRCLLHAAALDGRGAVDLYRWSLNPVAAEDAITVLTRSPGAADGWADALDAAVHADPRTRDSIWLGVRQALAALADPAVLDSVNPTAGERFDPAAFLTDSGTLYLLASAVSSGSCAPLVAAFVEDVTETARTLAARSPGARLDPPLLLALDEIANLTPLPSLPSLMAEGGGSGITTLAVLQSLAQARHRWGEHAADAIWDAATVKLVLGGLAKARDLDEVSRLLGDIDEPTRSISHGRSGERSTTLTVRQVPVMPPSMLRTLPFGTAVLLLRQTRPVVVDLHPWTARRDAPQLTAGRDRVEAQTGSAAPPPGGDVPS